MYEKNNNFVILYSRVFFIIIQYYDNDFQKLYFLMQFLPLCYRIHRSSYLKYGGPDPTGPRGPKSGGSADPADPVVPTPLYSLTYSLESAVRLLLLLPFIDLNIFIPIFVY